MKTFSEPAEEDIAIIFFDSIKKYDIQLFTNCLYKLNIEAYTVTDEKNMNALHHICFNNLLVFFSIFIDFKLKVEKNKDEIEFSSNNTKEILNKCVNKKCDNGFSPLMYAVYRGNMKIIKRLLEFQINIYDVNNDGYSLIHIAIISDQVNVMVYLKEKLKLSLNSANKNGSLPLHLACFYGSEYCLNVLLHWMNDVNQKNDDGNTPLHFLVLSEKSKLVKKLILKGAHFNIKNKKGMTALDLAKYKNITNIVEMLTNEDFKKIGSNFMKLASFPSKNGQFRYYNMFLFSFLHFICIIFGFFILCQVYISTFFEFIYLFIFFMVLFLYVILSLKNPGYLMNDSKFKSLLDIVENDQNVNDFCPYCIVKNNYDRKHCFVCKKCVEFYDHHCFWINNCVGYRNFLIFMAFLVVIFFNLIINIFLAMCVLYLDESKVQYNLTLRNNTFLLNLNYNYVKISTICIIHLILCFVFSIPVGLIFFLNLKGFQNFLNFKKKSEFAKNKSESKEENSKNEMKNDCERPLLNKNYKDIEKN